MSASLAATSPFVPGATLAGRQNVFEAAWMAHRPGSPLPRWTEFLPPAGDSAASDDAFRLIQADIEYRIKAGVPALLAEPYFQQALLNDSQQVELIRWEYQQRWQRGDRARRRDYIDRFPEHAAALQELKPRWNCPYCMRIAIPLDDESAAASACPHCHENQTISSLFPPLPPPACQPPAAAKGLDLRDYELLELLGRGGMGEVYLSRDPGLSRALALKILRPGFQGLREAEHRFTQEARITGALQHPGVVPVHNLGRLPDGRLYFTMKVVRGQTFDHILKQPGAGTPERRMRDLAIFEKVCQTLAYAHSNKVIHRDLKPANVMVGAFGEVQVMDWGLAKILSREQGPADAAARADESTVQADWSAATVLQSRSGDVLGTCAYMSPEQADGATEKLDERCDVFGLGAVLCEILTGQPPYLGPNLAVVLERARRGKLGPALERLDQCGAEPELIALAKRCLAVEPAARPRHAGEVEQAVAAFLGGVQRRLREAEQQRAVAEARAVEERKRRRLTLVLAATVLLLLLAGGSGAWLLQHQRAQALLVLEQGRGLLNDGWKTFDMAKLNDAKTKAETALKVAQTAAAVAFHQEVEERLERAERDRALLTALLDVSAPRETADYDPDPRGRGIHVPRPSLDGQYAAAFRHWGLDVDQSAAAEVVARLREEPEPVLQEIIAGLDSWMLQRQQEKRPENEWRRLLVVAEQLDSSPTRQQLRALLAGAPRPQDEIVAGLTGVLLPWTGLLALERGPHWQVLLQLRGQVQVETEPVGSLVLLAQTCSAKGDGAGAEEVLRRATVARPTQVVLLHARGKLLERQRRFLEAVACYQAARSLRPDLGVALAAAKVEAGQQEEGLALLRDLLRGQPNNPELHFHLGLLLGDSRPREAAAAFRQCIALYPDWSFGHAGLGVVLQRQGQLAEAELAFREAVRLEPNDALAHVYLGQALNAQQKFDEAAAAFRWARTLQPDNVEACSGLGFALVGQKKPEEALKALRQATVLRPDSAPLHTALGWGLLRLKQPQEAEAACRKSIALNPTSAEPYIILGDALIQQNRLPEAEAVFRQAIAVEPHNADAHNNLGVILMRQFSLEEVIAALGASLTTGTAEKVRKGKLEEAVTVLRRANEVWPNNPMIRANLRLAEKQLTQLQMVQMYLRMKSKPKDPKPPDKK
jgi:eukaryotic-like serine/threonine-protein kinase